MSKLVANSVQLGQSLTTSQNFTLSVPSPEDGTLKLSRNSSPTPVDIFTVNGSGVVNFVNPPTGIGGTKLLQVVESSTTSVITVSGSSIPFDDTIPQNTEGVEVLTINVTPISASSTLYLEAYLRGNHTTLGGVNSALFQDSIVNAVAAEQSAIYNYILINLRYSAVSGSTSPRTYKLRVGVGSGSLYINGDSTGVRVFGGTQKAKLTVWEVLP